VATDSREETDRYWDAIVSNGGEEPSFSGPRTTGTGVEVLVAAGEAAASLAAARVALAEITETKASKRSGIVITEERFPHSHATLPDCRQS
jgi:hypothetical protein